MNSLGKLYTIYFSQLLLLIKIFEISKNRQGQRCGAISVDLLPIINQCILLIVSLRSSMLVRLFSIEYLKTSVRHFIEDIERYIVCTRSRLGVQVLTLSLDAWARSERSNWQ